MPLTFDTRIRRVLLELLESNELTPKERLETARLLNELGSKRPGPKPGTKRNDAGLLG
jgi:hypothetical protein